MLKRLFHHLPKTILALVCALSLDVNINAQTASSSLPEQVNPPQENIAVSAGMEDVVFSEYDAVPIASENEIRKRLSSMRCMIKPVYTSAVHSYIRTYTQSKRDKAANILGKIPMYFPMFERKLSKKGVPSDLKYLAIVESALNPEATSRAGAAGLWQFMPSTGTGYGLQQSSTIDERRDPNKSTEAAINFLARLYSQYGDWELALAAYNSGPGRVNSAIKRARSHNFWRIQGHLPQETRNYVPAFIAACYLVNYYSLHGITPNDVSYEMKYTETTKVYERLSFQDISNLTGTPYHVIQALNPSYRNHTIPGSFSGDYLVLPFDKMANFVRYYPTPDAPSPNYGGGLIPGPDNLGYSIYVAEAGDNIHSICQKANCSSTDFKRWNNLISETIQQGQRFIINHTPKSNRLAAPSIPKQNASVQQTSNASAASALAAVEIKQKQVAVCAALPVLSVSNITNTKTLEKQSINSVEISLESQTFTSIIEHQVERKQSLIDIAKKYNTTIEQIIKLNNLATPEAIRAGDLLKIGVR